MHFSPLLRVLLLFVQLLALHFGLKVSASMYSTFHVRRKNINYSHSLYEKQAGVSQCGLAIYYNSITNSQVSTLAKISSFENPQIKIDLLTLPMGQNPLSYYILYNESKHNDILALVGMSNDKCPVTQGYVLNPNPFLPGTFHICVNKKHRNGGLSSKHFG